MIAFNNEYSEGSYHESREERPSLPEGYLDTNRILSTLIRVTGITRNELLQHIDVLNKKEGYKLSIAWANNSIPQPVPNFNGVIVLMAEPNDGSQDDVQRYQINADTQTIHKVS